MPTCDLCDEIAEKLYRCKECGSRFCSNCGDKTFLLCEYCQEDDEYTEEEEWSEDEP